MAEHSVKEVCCMDTVRLDEFGKDFGLVHEAIVTGRKISTPRELQTFFARLAHNEDKFRSVMDDVLNLGMTEAERMAQEILGEDRVVCRQSACFIRNVDQPETEPAMLYSEDILRECAEANASGTANWRFAYATGLNLRSQCKLIGCSHEKQPCFDPDWTWWLESHQDSWAKKPALPGYRLLDFTKRFSYLNWDVQGKEIAKLGDQFERAEEQTVAEICFSTFLMNKEERLLPNWYHWGKLRSARGRHVCVGHFDRLGFNAYNGWAVFPNDNLGVVLSRKFA